MPKPIPKLTERALLSNLQCDGLSDTDVDDGQLECRECLHDSVPSDIVAAILANLAVRDARPLAALSWTWKYAVEGHVSQALQRASHNLDFLTYAFPKLVVRRKSFGQCGSCGRVPRMVRRALQVCSLCRQVHYCNRACQQQHWCVHRMVCQGRIRHATIPDPSAAEEVD